VYPIPSVPEDSSKGREKAAMELCYKIIKRVRVFRNGVQKLRDLELTEESRTKKIKEVADKLEQYLETVLDVSIVSISPWKSRSLGVSIQKLI
jgi:valyl-tRNA synthetase